MTLRPIPPATLTELCAAETAAREALRVHQEEAAKREIHLKSELTKASERAKIGGAGLDLTKVELGRKALYLSGSYTNSPQRRGVVKDAIDWIATGEKRTYHTLEGGYFGVKNYSGFGDQREDHQYGMGPRHGSIVFAVGLREPKRNLTPDEREAALYYLLNIEAIQTASKAKEAA